MIIGICGKSGSGKSTVARLIAESKTNAVYCDIDKIGHYSLTVKEVKEEAVRCFGERILTDGNIDRKKLGKLVFSSKERMEELAQITWKPMQEVIDSIIQDSENKMFGVLIYLSTSDCEGSLGGLISIAENKELLGEILNNMLEKAEWCSGDPICITGRNRGIENLNYAACHDCCLIPETSCEFANAILDRASVVGTSEYKEIGLFYELLTIAKRR